MSKRGAAYFRASGVTEGVAKKPAKELKNWVESLNVSYLIRGVLK